MHCASESSASVPSAAIMRGFIATFSPIHRRMCNWWALSTADFARAQAVAKEFGTAAFHSVGELIEAGVQAVLRGGPHRCSPGSCAPIDGERRLTF